MPSTAQALPSSIRAIPRHTSARWYQLLNGRPSACSMRSRGTVIGEVASRVYPVGPIRRDLAWLAAGSPGVT